MRTEQREDREASLALALAAQQEQLEHEMEAAQHREAALLFDQRKFERELQSEKIEMADKLLQKNKEIKEALDENGLIKCALEQALMQNEETSARLHSFYESKMKSMQDMFRTSMDSFATQLDQQLSWQSQQAEEVETFARQM